MVKRKSYYLSISPIYFIDLSLSVVHLSMSLIHSLMSLNCWRLSGISIKNHRHSTKLVDLNPSASGKNIVYILRGVIFQSPKALNKFIDIVHSFNHIANSVIDIADPFIDSVHNYQYRPFMYGCSYFTY